MEIDTLRITGPDLSQMVRLFKDAVDDIRLFSYGNVYVFTIERYYFRIKSNLLTVIMFNYRNKGMVDVRIISGGGGEGLLSISWGAESSSNNTMMDILGEICESRGWSLCDAIDDETTDGLPDGQKSLETSVEEFENMMIKHNELLSQGKEKDAEKLYDDWYKEHPHEDEPSLK